MFGMMYYKQGDIVRIDFPYSDGSGYKARPAIIVSCNKFNAREDELIFVAMTTKGYHKDSYKLYGAHLTKAMSQTSYIHYANIYRIHKNHIRYKVSSLNEKGYNKLKLRIFSIIRPS